MEAGDQPQPASVIIEPAMMAGVWANVASLAQTPHEFTLDFIRMDGAQPNRGIVVARVAFSPLLASQLADLLTEAWQRYAQTELQLPDDGQNEGQEGSNEPTDEPPEPTEGPEA